MQTTPDIDIILHQKKGCDMTVEENQQRRHMIHVAVVVAVCLDLSNKKAKFWHKKLLG